MSHFRWITRLANFKEIIRGRSNHPIRHLEKRKNINWGPHRLLCQQAYDKLNSKRRIIKSLWESASQVRNAISQNGNGQVSQVSINQNNLNRDSEALKVKGIIYAIYSIHSHRLYIGQTKNSALRRFEEHVQASLRGDNEKLHIAMRKSGWKHFRVFPLEIIDPSKYNRGSKRARLRAFRSAATPRERFWIDELHTYNHKGYNIQFGKRRRKRIHRQNNPMKFRRHPRDPNKVRNIHSHLPENVGLRWYGSRDWHRRCVYLGKRFVLGTLDTVRWSDYASRSLNHMLNYLEHVNDPLDIDPLAYFAILKNLRKYVLVRKRSYGKPKRKLQYLVTVEWTTHHLRSLGLRNIILDPHIKQLLPHWVLNNWDDTSFIVCKSLSEPIRNTVCNFSRVLKNMDTILLQNSSSCPCRSLYDSRFRPDNGCVLTGSLDLIWDNQLRYLLSLGPSFRDKSVVNSIDSIVIGLDRFIHQHSSRDNPSSAFLLWREAILGKCKEKLINVRNINSNNTYPLLNTRTLNILKYMQQQLVIVPVDKAAGNFSFVCKLLYCKKIQHELTSPLHIYEIAQDTITNIINRHYDYIHPLGLECPTKLPFLYWLPKFHKSPIGARFIASALNCTLSPLSKFLSNALLFIMHSLREKDQELIQTSGIRRYWIVETYDEVTNFLSRWQHENNVAENTGLYTGDFATMYTAIPHHGLFTALSSTITEAFTWAATKHNIRFDQTHLIQTTPGTFQWVKGSRRTADKLTLSPDKLMEYIRFLVSNTYVQAGKSIHRQTIGIPMGTNCAPPMANLYLYYYESNYMTRILNEQGENTARSFRTSFRLIDDLLSVGNPNLRLALSKPAEEGGLYPSALQLEQTSTTNLEVEFIGVKITQTGKRFRLSVYDKRKSFPFFVRRYPNMLSMIPKSIPYGVFSGLLYRAYNICSHVPEFISQSLEIAHTLLNNGCMVNKLNRMFNNFIYNKIIKYTSIPKKQIINIFKNHTQNHTHSYIYHNT